MGEVLTFKDNKAAFQYACDFLDCKGQDNKVLPALVTKIAQTKDGLQACALLLASRSGGDEVLYCTTLNETVPPLTEGDLVAYHLIKYKRLSLLRGHLGFVIAKLEPQYEVNRGWRVTKQ